MEQTSQLLAQLLSLSGLVGASGAYAGIVRRRRELHDDVEAAQTSSAAAERIDRHMALSRIDHTYVRSAVRHRDNSSDLEAR